jgi:hypothetical protein
VALELTDNETADVKNDSYSDEEESNESGSVNEAAETSLPEAFETSLQNIQRLRRRPVWMNDYTSGEEFSDEDTLAHLVLFAESDPIAFDEAIKYSRRKAMDA